MGLGKKLSAYLQLMRFDRPIGILLLLWPTLWSLWLASSGSPQVNLLIIFVVGVVVMRAAGCIVNDLADRQFDGQVARTKQRPLVSGKLSVKEALSLFIVLCAVALGLVLLLNKFVIFLAAIGLLLACGYPFAKRFFPIPQLVLGLAFSWSIPMAFAAVLGYVPNLAWLLFLANGFWIVAYDTEYAMVDREDDLKVGIKSSAIFFGRWDRLAILVCQLLALFLLFMLGYLLHIGLIFYISLLLSLFFMLYQQWLIARRHPSFCFRAFLNNNWVGAVIFLGIVFGA